MLTPFVLTLTAASSVPVLVAPTLFRALLELRYPAAPPDQVGAPDLPADTHTGRPRLNKAAVSAGEAREHRAQASAAHPPRTSASRAPLQAARSRHASE